MRIRILEVAGVPAPERVVSRLDDRGAGLLRLLHHGVHFAFRGDVMADAEVGWASAGDRKPGIVRKARSRPERELQAGLEIEESDRAVLELRADDALGLQSQPVAVEPHRAVEIVDSERKQGDARLHDCELRACQRTPVITTAPSCFARSMIVASPAALSILKVWGICTNRRW